MLSSIFTFTDLSIVSFNCKGHNDDRLDYIKQLSSLYDVVLLQEHWYHDHQIVSLSHHIDNVQVHVISGMDKSELLMGRPYGGC